MGALPGLRQLTLFSVIDRREGIKAEPSKDLLPSNFKLRHYPIRWSRTSGSFRGVTMDQSQKTDESLSAKVAGAFFAVLVETSHRRDAAFRL